MGGHISESTIDVTDSLLKIHCKTRCNISTKVGKRIVECQIVNFDIFLLSIRFNIVVNRDFKMSIMSKRHGGRVKRTKNRNS